MTIISAAAQITVTTVVITTDYRALVSIQINGLMQAEFPISDLAVMRAFAICVCQTLMRAPPNGPR